MTEVLSVSTAQYLNDTGESTQGFVVRRNMSEPSVDAVTEPEYYGWSQVDPSQSQHFDSLSPAEQRRRMSVLGSDVQGNELIDKSAESYSDYLRDQIEKSESLEDAMDIFHRHDTDPINGLDLLAHIAHHYAGELKQDQEAQHIIIELAEKGARGAEKVVLGEAEHASPEAGLRGLVVAADIVAENPEAEAEIIGRLDKAVKASHDANGTLINGHAVADPLLAEAISDAISDRLQIPTTAGITLGELVDQHVEIKKLDLEEQQLIEEIATKKAALQELRSQRSEVSSNLEHEVRSASKRRTGIRGLLNGLVKVSR